MQLRMLKERHRAAETLRFLNLTFIMFVMIKRLERCVSIKYGVDLETTVIICYHNFVSLNSKVWL